MINILQIVFNFIVVVLSATAVISGLVFIATRFGGRGRFLAGLIGIILFLNIVYFAAYG